MKDELSVLTDLLARIEAEAERREVSAGVLCRKLWNDNQLTVDIGQRIEFLKSGDTENRGPRSLSLAMYFKINQGLQSLKAEKLRKAA